MKLLRMFLSIGVGVVALLSSTSFACGSACNGDPWGGLFEVGGYTGYNFGTSLFDIGNTSSSSLDGWGGGCGGFFSSCGSSWPLLTFDIDIPVDLGMSCGSSCSSGLGGSSFGGLFNNNPFLSNSFSGLYSGLGQFNDPFSLYCGSGYTGSTNSIFNPITGNWGTSYLNYPYISIPGITSNLPGISNPFLPGSLPSSLYPSPYLPGWNSGYPTFGYNPLDPIWGNYPRVSYPGGVPIISPPDSNLPYGGCDNLVVMCPGTGAGSINPPIASPQNPGGITPVTNPTGNYPTYPIGTPTPVVNPLDPSHSTGSITSTYVPVNPNTGYYPRGFGSRRSR